MKCSLVSLKNEVEILDYIKLNDILNDKQLILFNKWFKNIKKNELLILNYLDLIQDNLDDKITEDSNHDQPIEYILHKIKHICCLKINICNIIYKE
jgi:hypothetical protein